MTASTSAPTIRTHNPYNPVLASLKTEVPDDGSNLFLGNSQITSPHPSPRSLQYLRPPHHIALPRVITPPSYVEAVLAMHYNVFGEDVLRQFFAFMYDTHYNVSSIPDYAQLKFNRRFEEFKRMQPQYANYSVDEWAQYHSDFLRFINENQLYTKPLYQQINDYVNFLINIKLSFIDTTNANDLIETSLDDIKDSGAESELDADSAQTTSAQAFAPNESTPTTSQQDLPNENEVQPNISQRRALQQCSTTKPPKKKMPKSTQVSSINPYVYSSKSIQHSRQVAVITSVTERNGQFDICYQRRHKITDDTATLVSHDDIIRIKRGDRIYILSKRQGSRPQTVQSSQPLTTAAPSNNLQVLQNSQLKKFFNNMSKFAVFTIKIAYVFISSIFLKFVELIGIHEIIRLGYLAHTDFHRISSTPSQFMPKDLVIKIEGLTKTNGNNKYITTNGYVYIGETQIINGIELPKNGKLLTLLWEYDGEWANNGIAHGDGHITWFDRRWPLFSSKKKKIIRSYYTGTFESGKLDKGDMFCTDNTVFRGYFTDNTPRNGCLIFRDSTLKHTTQKITIMLGKQQTSRHKSAQ